MKRSDAVVVKKSKIAGKGLFAKRDIKKGEKLFRFEGKVIRESYGTAASKKFNEAAITEKKLLTIGRNWIAIGKETWIDPYANTVAPFLNHSCDPNAGFRGLQTIVAMRNIKKGEEVTTDYSITEEDPEWHMPCRCKAKNCRKVIKSVRFLPPRTYQKYAPFMSPFLKASYLRAHKTKK